MLGSSTSTMKDRGMPVLFFILRGASVVLSCCQTHTHQHLWPTPQLWSTHTHETQVLLRCWDSSWCGVQCFHSENNCSSLEDQDRLSCYSLKKMNKLVIWRWNEGMKYQKMKHRPHGIVQRLINQNFEFVLFRRIHKCQVGHLHVHTDACERARRTETKQD